MKKAYIVSMLDQGILSFFNMMLNLSLIRLWGAEGFGVYAFWTSVGLLCFGIQNAFVNVPMSVFLPGAQTAESQYSRRKIEVLLSSINNYYILLCVTLVTLLTQFTGQDDIVWTQTLCFVFFVASSLTREYTRSIAFATFRAPCVLWIDLSYTALAGGIIVSHFLIFSSIDLRFVFCTLGVASMVGSLVGLLSMRRVTNLLSFRDISWTNYAPIWKQAKWSLVGVIAQHLKDRGYVYLVTTLGGFEAAGILAATAIIFRPVGMALTAWSRVARPQLARAAAHQEYKDMWRILRMSTAGFVLGFFALCLLVYLSWPLIDRHLFSQKYGQVNWIVVQWAISAAVAGLVAIAGIVLTSLKMFKELTMAVLYGSAVAMMAIPAVTLSLGYEFVPLGVIFGSIVTLVCLCSRLSKVVLVLSLGLGGERDRLPRRPSEGGPAAGS